jgi:GTPase Era involved in 16S rRNA processing
MNDTKYKATLSGEQGRSGLCVIFRHPVRKNADGTAVRIRRGLGTRERSEGEKLVGQLNEILGNRDFWTPTAKAKAEAMFDPKVVNAFYDNFLPATQDAWALREQIIPLPGREDGYAHARFLGTTGAGKTTLVRQLIGTDPEKERFPSTSTAKTTVCDIEVVMASGPYKAVVTFFPRDHVRLHIEECALAAAAAIIFEKGGTATAASRLLEHTEQRFRLSYVLGNIRADEDELSDDGEPKSEASCSETGEVSDEEREIMSRKIEGYVERINAIANESAQKLAKALGVRLNRTEGEDENAFQELFEDELKQNEGFHLLVDEIMDAVEDRFALLDSAGFQRDRNDWPLLWQFETADRVLFVKTVNRFSSNYAPNFGRLLTPLVQGLRVRGGFAPTWHQNGECKLVLLDGEGLGHTPDSSSSISTSITQRFKEIDAVVLVDNAEQPMQAAPQALVRTLAASGNERKLMVCFTHFDQVKGPNLPNMTARKEHVFRSLENAISNIREVLGRSAENALRRETVSKTFFLSNIQNPIKEANRLTITELQRLVEAIRDSIKPRPSAQVVPIYDMANLILSIPQAMNAFRDPWRGRLRLPSQSVVSPEHWTRIKALSRRFAELGSTEYDTLRPVADFIARLIEHVTVVLSNPVRWEPENAPEEMRRQVVADISSAVHGKLHELGESRLFHERVKEWSVAYSHRGTGSSRERAMDIEGIYGVAAPIPSQVADPHSNALVSSIKMLVQEAVEGAGGDFE